MSLYISTFNLIEYVDTAVCILKVLIIKNLSLYKLTFKFHIQRNLNQILVLSFS